VYEKRDDYYWVVLRFSQPAHGVTEVQTGEEEFVFDEVGNLVDRQVLVWPDGIAVPVEQHSITETRRPEVPESDPITPPSPPLESAPSEPQTPHPTSSVEPTQPQFSPAKLTGVHLASRRRRTVAFTIDCAIQLAIQLLTAGAESSDAFVVAYLIAIMAWFVLWLYGTSHGWSPGKIAVGIRIVNHNQEKPGWARALVRELIGKPIGAVPLFLGFFWIIWDGERRGWHDHIAKTHVIQVR